MQGCGPPVRPGERVDKAHPRTHMVLQSRADQATAYAPTPTAALPSSAWRARHGTGRRTRRSLARCRWGSGASVTALLTAPPLYKLMQDGTLPRSRQPIAFVVRACFRLSLDRLEGSSILETAL